MDTDKSALDFRHRDSYLRILREESFDLLVIGGGITGAGIARDAALRGLHVALIDAQDFAAGTSSRSTKLIHGGLRYLAQGDIKLVREAATERATLQRLAPHLAQSQRFLLPVSNKASQIKFRVGLWAYEKLGQVATSDTHRILSLAEVKATEPALDTHGWHSALTYGECITEDAKLTIANIRSAKAAGASVASYCKVLAFNHADGKVCGVQVKDTLGEEGTQFNIKAKVVVNAAGPWVDSICRLGSREKSAHLQLTKGVHIVLPRKALPLNKPLIASAKDKRTIFIIPKDDIIYVGTTDTFHPSAAYWPQATREDIDYLLTAVNSASKTKTIGYDQISSLWTGLRPLIAKKRLGKREQKPYEISREDETWEGSDGLLSIAGGKLTAYRRMAERVVDKVEQKLGHKISTSITAYETLPGGDISLDGLRAHPELSSMDKLSKNRLIRNYGQEAISIAQNGGNIEAEVTHGVLKEGALKLEDFWIRRSGRSLFDADGGLASLELAATKMGALLHWSLQRQESEIHHCKSLHESRMAWRHGLSTSVKKI